MTEGYLLSRKLLRLRSETLTISSKSPGDLSALAWTDTSTGRILWLGGDEALGIGATGDAAKKAKLRNAILTLRADGGETFILSEVTLLRDALPQVPFIVDAGDEEEVDIEGIDLAGDHLWLVGSHSTKRKKPKKKDRSGERLGETTIDANRFLLARLTVKDGVIATESNGDGKPASAALLPMDAGGGNPLTAALADDPHLAPFLVPMQAKDGPAGALPGKDNGFDVEGLAVRNGRVYLGLRGPVLRGWATLLAIAPQDGAAPGTLQLGPVGEDGPLVARHFVYLGGMGIRDLSFDGDDLLILAGPTMDMDGVAAVWRLRKPHQLADGSLSGAPAEDEDFDAGRLKRLFDLPTALRADRAEGLVRYDQWGERAVMIVYDAAAAARHPLNGKDVAKADAVFADIFRLPPG